VLGRERACAIPRYDYSGVLVWRETRIRGSEPQPGPKIGVGCASQHKRPVWHSRVMKTPRTVNHGPPQVSLLLDTSNILSSRLCFNLPLCGKLVCFKVSLLRPVSVRGRAGVARMARSCFVKLRLMNETRAFVACMDTHDPLPWEIRVVQTGHTNISSHVSLGQHINTPFKRLVIQRQLLQQHYRH
jgi:hypothetical protein